MKLAGVALPVASLPGRVYRVSWSDDPWRWPTRGRPPMHRYDDPLREYRVTYASTSRLAAFVECLDQFRPEPDFISAIGEIEVEPGEPETIDAGVVPQAWISEHHIGEAHLTGTYAAITSKEWISHLRAEMNGSWRNHGVDDLDASALRRSDRRALTQAVSRLVYEHSTPDGQPMYDGIRYPSKHGDDLKNWAIFELSHRTYNPWTVMCREPIRSDDPDLLAACDLLHLRLEQPALR